MSNSLFKLVIIDYFRQRFGVFSYPLPLTVGDHSTFYDKKRKSQLSIEIVNRY